MDTKSKINYYNKGFKGVALAIALIGTIIITAIVSQGNAIESIAAFIQNDENYGLYLLNQEVDELIRARENIYYSERDISYNDFYSSKRLQEYKETQEKYLQKGYSYYYTNQAGAIILEDEVGEKFYNPENISKDYLIYSGWNEVALDGDAAYLRVVVPKTILEEKINIAQEISINGKNNLIGLILGSSLLLFGSIYLTITAGKKSKDQAVVLKGLDKIYTDVLLILVGFLDAGIITLGAIAYMNLGDKNTGQMMVASIFALGGAFFIVNAFTILNISKKIKAKRLLKQSLIWNIIINIGKPLGRILVSKPGIYIKETIFTLKELSNKSIYRSLMSWAIITTGLLIVVIIVSLPFGFIPAIIGIPLVVMFMLKKLTDKTSEFVEISQGVSEIRRGNYSYKIQRLSVVELNEVAENVNNIAEGMESAVKKAVKAEQLKSELITNVSHDLKTPLTSIIGYVELLEHMDLPEEAQSYVEIISQKSDRLKHIIQDLFDLTKTTSGNIELELEELDLVKITHQTLGEMEIEIENSGKSLKLISDLDKAIINADGKKLYRVLQNLLDNALKYSMPGTRIFITLKREDGKINFEIKNTASYEMDFTEEEILQRFSRGDKARSTQGNGLGLSIAEGFTLAQGGEFEVKIDGDQFKVILSFIEN